MAAVDEPIVLSDSEDERPAKRRAGKEPAAEAAAGGVSAEAIEVIEIEDIRVRCCSCGVEQDQDDTLTSAECRHPSCMACLQKSVQLCSSGTGLLLERLVCLEKDCGGHLRFAALGFMPRGAVRQDVPDKLEMKLASEARGAAAAQAGTKGCSCGAHMRLVDSDKVCIMLESIRAISHRRLWPT